MYFCKICLKGVFMKNKRFILWAALFCSLALLCVITGCGQKEEKGPPGSMDSYANREPPMAPNPNRAVARAGSNTTIGVPEYLLASLSPSARAAGDVGASFAVHADDTAIAEIVSQNGSNCVVRGLQLGTARIIVTVGGQSATMLIAVSPSEGMYTLPAAEVRRLGESEFYHAWWNSDRPDDLPGDSDNYNSDPTYSLAWIWRNIDDPDNNDHGASGPDCGIDILAYFVDPGVPDRRGWVRTTYGFGGWHYDLNGETNAMNNGIQTSSDGKVKLQLTPTFIYDDGVPYLEIKHTLTNLTGSTLTNQKFGAAVDVMIFNQDDAPVSYLPYGALMSNQNTYDGVHYVATVKLRLVCQNLVGINNVSTLWMGQYGIEREHVYDNDRHNITAEDDLDSALCFSYKNITLGAHESKTFTVRFTQVQ